MLGMELHMQSILVGVGPGVLGAGKHGKAFGASDIYLP